MSSLSRMPRYDVRNDGVGPYTAFYCDRCSREYRSQPDLKGTITTDIGRQAVGGLLGKLPVFGRAVADNVVGEDPRYVTRLTPQQLEAAWQQVQPNFRLCPTCQQIVCVPDFDMQAGTCNECSPRRGQIAEAQAEQAAGVVKGIASAFGLADAVRNIGQAAQSAKAGMARCAKDGTLAPAGTRFCPQCGSPMVQPAAGTCPKCGAATRGARFCPECGAKIEAAAAPTVCANCGAELKGAKFCPECGTKAG